MRLDAIAGPAQPCNVIYPESAHGLLRHDRCCAMHGSLIGHVHISVLPHFDVTAVLYTRLSKLEDLMRPAVAISALVVIDRRVTAVCGRVDSLVSTGSYWLLIAARRIAYV